MRVARFVGLPNDVLFLLADILPDDTLNTLARTSRHLSVIFDHALYSRNARRQNSLALQWASYYGVIGTVKKALAAGADLESRRLPPHHPRQNSHRGFYEASEAKRQIPYYTALTIAAMEGRLEIASLLIDAGARVDVSPKDNYGSTPFSAAVEGDHLEMAKLLVATGSICFHSLAKNGTNILTQAVETAGIDLIRYILPKVKDGDLHTPMMPTPLILAVKRQRLDVIQLLLDSKNITPDLADDHGRTALAWAAVATEGAAGSVLQLLLSSGLFDPNSTDRHGRTPISLAASVGNDIAVSLLLSRSDIDPNIADRAGHTPIFHGLPYSHITRMFIQSGKVTMQMDTLFRAACEKASTDVLKQFLKIDLGHHNVKDESGSTWLHAAASHGHGHIVKLLLKRQDTCIDQQRLDGFTPLLCAVKGKHTAATKTLLQAGANVNISTRADWSALCYASQGSNVALVEELLRRGSDVSKLTNTGETALHIACRHGQAKVVSVLLANRADPISHGTANETPLHIACASRQEHIVELLIAKIPNGHSILRNGRTPLHDVCESGHARIAKRLLEHGADPMAALENGCTPIELASRGHSLIAEMLLKAGASPQQRTSSGATILHQACEYNSINTASLLINNGANLNVTDSVGSTPLHVACLHGSSMLVRMLIKCGASVIAAETDGSTALHRACGRTQRLDSTLIAQMLLEHGADVNAMMHDGRTPLHMACASMSHELVQVLLAHGADALAEYFDSTTAARITPIHLVCRLIPETGTLILLLRQIKQPYAEIWNTGWTPLHEAATALNSETLRLLLTCGANPNTVADNGRTALHQVFAHSRLRDAAIQRKAKLVISALLATGKLDINRRDNDGKTVLSDAAETPELLRVLLGN